MFKTHSHGKSQASGSGRRRPAACLQQNGSAVLQALLKSAARRGRAQCPVPAEQRVALPSRAPGLRRLRRGSSRYLVAVLLAALLVTACRRDVDTGIVQGRGLPQSPLLGALEKKVGLIAYVGIDGNIYTMDQAGGKVTQITSDARVGEDLVRYYSLFAWAPDGEKLAYVSYAGTSLADARADLYTSRGNGTDVQAVYSSDGALPVFLDWAPDGEALAFVSTNSDGATRVLRLIPAAGGEARIIDTGQPLFWDWSPSGQRMLVHAGGAFASRSDARIAFLTVTDPVIEEGLTFRPTQFNAPAFSPDGSRVLFAAETESGDSALYIGNLAGEVEQVITTYEGKIAFDWSPDGQHIAYAAGEDLGFAIVGPLVIWSVDTASVVYESEQQAVIAFFWSPDGRRIAYFEPVLAELPSQGEGEEAQQALVFTLYVTDLEADETTGLHSFFPTEMFQGVLPAHDQFLRMGTIWSPDSKNVVVAARTRSGPRILVVQAAGDFAPRELEPGTLAFWSWR